MDNKKPKNNFNKEINILFEKLISKSGKKIKNIEKLKQNIIFKLNKEITNLYAKKDFIAKVWNNKEKLKLQKVSLLRKILKNSLATNLRLFFSIPFIYSMIFPAIILHIMIEIYHQICFRLYSIPLVKVKEYFIFDRNFLPYLNWFEKFNCFYCSYFNCLISYTKEIAGRTERYWCPIKYSKILKDPHSNYDNFIDYSDGKGLRKKWQELRKF